MQGPDLAEWRDLYIMLGTSAGALIGLLFVVTSLHLDEIINNPAYRLRARNNMYYLLLLLAQAGLILTPQPIAWLGAELGLTALFLFQFHLRNGYKFRIKHKESGDRGGFSSLAAARFLTSDLLGVAGGGYLIAQSRLGLYLIAASYFLFLASVIINAWTIMLQVGQAEENSRTG